MSRKPFRCSKCGKPFKTSQACDQHERDAHKDKEGAKAVMDSMGDLPDGAFWEMAEEMGLEPEDFLS